MNDTETMTGPAAHPIVTRSRIALEAALRDLDTSARASSDATPRSPFRVGQKELRAAGQTAKTGVGLWRRAASILQATQASARDHVLCTIRLLSGPDIPLYGHVTTARAAGEAAAQTSYLLAVGITAEERMLRFAACLLQSANDQLKGATNLPPEMALLLTRAQDYEQRIRDYIDACNIEITKSRLTLRTTGLSVSRSPRISQLAKDAFPKRHSWYNSFSGTAHSREWALTNGHPVLTAPDGGLVMEADLLEVGSATLLLLDAMALMGRDLALFFGHDPEPAAKKYRRREKAVDEAMKEYGMELIASQRNGGLPARTL